MVSPFEKFEEILESIFNFLNPFSEDFFLKIAFVPDTDNLIFDEVKDVLYSKFKFIKSIEKIHNDFNDNFNKYASCPDFTIKLPAFLGGSLVKPIDFRFFNDYRIIIHGLIIALSYFFFIKKLSHKLPNLIKGE